MRFLIVLILIPILGCSQKSTQVFMEDDKEITVAVGDTFTIQLASQIGTGYTWQLQEEDQKEELLNLLSKEYIESEQTADGSPGADHFTFQALKKGSTELIFAYQRPWEDKSEDADAATRKTFQVSVK